LFIIFEIDSFNNECLKTCPINYHNITGQTKADYICVQNNCDNRIPYEGNNSCMLNGETSLCYTYKLECRSVDRLPSDISCVCEYFCLYFININENI
jgi:hypothetical protein